MPRKICCLAGDRQRLADFFWPFRCLLMIEFLLVVRHFRSGLRDKMRSFPCNTSLLESDDGTVRHPRRLVLRIA